MGDGGEMGALENRQAGFRVLHIACDAADETLQILRPSGKQEAPLIAVGIDVSDGMLLQFIHMSFHPLDRTQQPGLLPIPGAVDDGALWSPAPAVELSLIHI